MTDLDRELALEDEMLSLGMTRFWAGVQKAKEANQESQTIYGQQLAAEGVRKMSQEITTWLASLSERRGGPRPVAAKYLMMVEPDVAAWISIKTVLDCISLRRTTQKTAVAIGSAIEDEVRFTQFAQTNKAMWKTVVRDLNERNYSQERKRTVLIHTMNKLGARKQPELLWQEWGQKDKFHLGYKCLDLLVQSTQLVQVVTVNKGRHESVSLVEATPTTMEWIAGKTGRCELLAPVFLPMIVEPKPWTTVDDGGYYSPAIRPLKLVKTRQKNYLEELFHLAEEMPLVYQAVNAVQSTAWRVNRKVLGVMQHMWDSGSEAGELPSRQDIPLPPKPADITTNKAARTAWRREAAGVHHRNIKLRSKRLQMVKLLYLAEKFEREPRIYFPHQLDFRGRLYAVPSYLNPQGNDMAKSLLQFAEGKPAGVDGARWLKIHAANCFGVDKCSLEDRVKWAQDHLPDILRSAGDPLAHRWWTEADKPWQFLAACFEVQQVTLNPEYVSHLPVSVDGTCNGLQNFSAMLRDAVGGAATNLLPSDLPHDIYQRVADVAAAKVASEADAGETLACQWQSFGFDRKATKRPVMVLPYGGTLYSSRQYVADWIEERAAAGDVEPWGESGRFAAASYLAKHIWSSIGEVVVAARAAMDWLQTVAALAASEELPVNWVTPVGFPVLQAYPNMDRRSVKTKLGDRIVWHLLQEETDTLDRKRQASGISPNFVHSMDAAALMLSVHHCLKVGITNFGMVHDSYGTHAADMEQMSVCLREAFVELYQTDVLEEFRKSIAAGLSEKHLKDLPPVPQKGTLDLALVKQSRYFFA